jgi:hypothetical protein
MLFLPPSDLGLLIGTGNAGRSDFLPYIASDVGYVRVIFSVGLVGLAVLALGYVPLGVMAWRVRFHSSLAAGVLFYLAVMFVANFKELHVVPRGGAALLAAFSMAAALTYEREMRLQSGKCEGGADRGFARWSIASRSRESPSRMSLE